MALDWKRPVRTRDGRGGYVLADLPHERRKRVVIGNANGRIADAEEAKRFTTWLYNQDGTIDADPSGAWTLENAA